jgi:PhzF family phenazine biosynthesis protein
MKINIKIVHAFSMGEQGGNPAGLVLDANSLDNDMKQAIAAKLGMSETAFISQSKVADFKLEFFTPTRQIAHCGHATVAAFSYLKQNGQIPGNHSSKETIDGTRSIFFEGNTAYMEQKAPTYFIPETDMPVILESLQINAADIVKSLVPTIVNTGNSFLVIPAKNETILGNLQVDFDKISQISKANDLIGYYVYAASTENKKPDAITRMFAPFYGITEESATGMAAGPLACYLHKNDSSKSSFVFEQGKFMRPASESRIKVNLHLEGGAIINLFAGGNAFVADEKIIEI